MPNLNVKHYLEVYTNRMLMQQEGITSPPDEIKVLTKTIVEKLSLLPLDEEIYLREKSLVDCRGNVIVTFPLR